MDYETIILDIDGPIANLTINRPDVLNAINPKMAEELASAVIEVENRETVKALVIRGAGRAFCAGADLGPLGDSFDNYPAMRAFMEDVNALYLRFEDLPVPIIAVVHGYVLAGGLEMMLACDMVIAAEDARIGDQHINFALMPGAGSSQRLPRKLGVQKAMELLLTGRWLSGQEASEWGLVLRAAPADKLDEELEKLLSALRDKSRPALGWIKRTALQGLNMALRDGIALEIRSFAQYVATSSHPREGVQAFKEKRQPKF